MTSGARYNWASPSAPALVLRATAFVKSCAARGVEGPLTNLKDEADAYYRRRHMEKENLRAAEAARGVPPPPPRGERGLRWPAKWSAYCTSARVPPQSRRLLMVVAASGMQYELGEIEIVSVREGEQGALAAMATGAALATAAAAGKQAAGKRAAQATAATEASASAMARWLGGTNGAVLGSNGAAGLAAGLAGSAQHGVSAHHDVNVHHDARAHHDASARHDASGHHAGSAKGVARHAAMTPVELTAATWGDSPWVKGALGEGLFAVASLGVEQWIAIETALRPGLAKGHDGPSNSAVGGGAGGRGGAHDGAGGSNPALITALDEEAMLREVLEASAREHASQQQALLEAILAASSSAVSGDAAIGGSGRGARGGGGSSGDSRSGPGAGLGMSEEEHLEAALAASLDEAARDAQRRAAAAAAMPMGVKSSQVKSSQSALPIRGAHASVADEGEELATVLELSRQIAACTRACTREPRIASRPMEPPNTTTVPNTAPRIASRPMEVDLTADEGGGEACAGGTSVDAPIELSSDEDEAVARLSVVTLPARVAVAVDDASTEEDEPTTAPAPKEVREARLRHFVA